MWMIAARIGIKLNIYIWLAVINWLNKKANTEKIIVRFNIFKFLLFFFIFLKVKIIKGIKKIWINLNSPINLFKLIWSIKLM